MRRNTMIFITLLAVLILLAGCSGHHEVNLPKAVKFYYCNTDISYNESDGLISAESRDYIGNTNNIEEILNEYLKGPSNDKFYSPFPNGTALIEAEMGDDILYITLNKAFSELSGIDRTLACACITRTLQEITNVDSVVIDVYGGIYGNNTSVTLDKSSFITVDSSLYSGD